MQEDHPHIASLLAVLGRARGASQLYLRFAIEALRTDGAGGRLIVHIPRKTNEIVEIEFHGINTPKEK